MEQALPQWRSLFFCALKNIRHRETSAPVGNIYSLERRETPIIKTAGISLSYSRGYMRDVSNESARIAVKIQPNVAPKRIFTQCCIAAFPAEIPFSL